MGKTTINKSELNLYKSVLFNNPEGPEILVKKPIQLHTSSLCHC